MKLAIIGASTGQFPLCKKAKDLGIETFCFAYDKGAVCKDVVDHFYPISIFEMDKIVAICRDLGIEGVVSNASDVTAEVVAYIAEKLHLSAPSYGTLLKLQNKFYVRSLTNKIEGLSTPIFYKYAGVDKNVYPCVVKPCQGGAKKGVSFVCNSTQFAQAIQYATVDNDSEILVEEYVEGKELSIECISSNNKHYVIQITDKDSSGAPHFVELGHHQPANLPENVQQKIYRVIPKLLSVIGYHNGASHIEVKYSGEQIYLIEVNLRGGGDDISNRLVQLSTGIDYLKCMIDVALNRFDVPVQKTMGSYAGIYYLCKQTEYLVPFFERSKNKEWIVEEKIYSRDLQESYSNYERNGYLIYHSDHKITPDND